MELIIYIILAAYAAVVLYRPVWGIYAVLALLPVYQIRFSIAGIPSTLLEWLILLLAMAVAVRYAAAAVKSIKALAASRSGAWLAFWILLFILAAAIGIAVSPQPIKAVGIYKAYFLEGALFWLICLVLLDSREKIIRAFLALGIPIIYLSLFGIFQFFTLYRLPPSWWGPGIEPRRLVSLYTYPNAVALLITPILALFTGLLLFAENNWRKKYLAAVLALGLLLLFLTFSRGAWIGYAASALVLGLLSRYRTAMLAALAAAALIVLIVPVARNRILPAVTGTDPASLERIKLYRGAITIIKEQPFFGSGLMGFRDWYGSVRSSNTDEILNYPHNLFLNFWVETGFFGLFAVLGMLGWTITKIRQFSKDRSYSPIAFSILAAIVALVVHGLVDAPFFKNDLAVLFWFLLAAMPAAYIHKNTMPNA